MYCQAAAVRPPQMVSPATARSQKRCGVCHWPTTLLTALTTSGRVRTGREDADGAARLQDQGAAGFEPQQLAADGRQ